MTERKKVLLQGVFDYLIFFKNLVKITYQNNTLNGLILERTSELITIEVPTLPLLDIERRKSGTRFQFSCLYKGMYLHFDGNLKEIRKGGISSIFQFIVPATHGILTNVRTKARVNLDDDTIHATLAVESRGREITFSNSRLVDFSSDSMSILLDQNTGIALPGENVSFAIFKGEQSVLNGSGYIIRAVKTQAELNDDSQVVVVAFNKTSKKNIGTDQRRVSDRVFLLNDRPGFIYFEHPLKPGYKISGGIADLSNRGISILCEEEHALPRGLHIANAEIQLPLDPSIKTELKVSGYSQLETEEREIYRIGFEFARPHPELLKRVSSFVQKNASPHLTDATAEDCDRLWAFFFESRFIYGAKRQQLQSNAERVVKTYEKLLKNNPPILKKILYKQNGEIKGHIVAIKIFDETFIIQHLAASKAQGASAGQAVIRGITSFFLDASINRNTQTRYVCAYYRPSNLYPSLVFGETEHIINNPDICSTRIYRFCVFSSQQLAATPDVTCGEAKLHDLDDLEAILIASHEFQLMRVEGLTRDKITSLELTSEYNRVGLYRNRRVFVARKGNDRAYAVCNYSSPGINLSELTNSVKFYYSLGANPVIMQELANALSPVVVESYQKTEMSDMVLLIQSEQPVPAGFNVKKQYTMWILNTDYVSKFKDATEYIFKNIRDFVKKHRNPELH